MSTLISRVGARDHRLTTFHYYNLLVHVFVVVLLIVNRLKRSEGVDVYDAGTDFSPFAKEPQMATAAVASE